MRRSSIGYDAYHFLRTTTWPRLMGLFAIAFLLLNLMFATIYWVTGAKVLNEDGFHDLYWFSVQTMATIGYGYLAPGDDVANAIVTVESFFGIAYTALVTGLFFARFSTPTARVAPTSAASPAAPAAMPVAGLRPPRPAVRTASPGRPPRWCARWR